jgi:RNA polymerase sigma-70 factor, ECF subfamily
VPGSETTSDAELVRRLRAGDEAAFREVVRSLHGALVKVALAFVGSRGAAEEIVQDTWLAVIAGLEGFEGRSTLRTWIGHILVNRAKTRGARDKRAAPLPAAIEDDELDVDAGRFGPRGYWASPPTAWDHAPEALTLRKEACEHIERELLQLPPLQGTVVMLRDMEGWSAAEVCAALEIGEANQRVLLHRGRARLRAALERYHSGEPSS